MSGTRAQIGRRQVLSSGYVVVLRPGHPRADERGNVREHILVVEAAMGKYLPGGKNTGPEIHHVNEIRSDNSNRNLVVCQDADYHKLLHLRQRALDACGNADWRKCRYCKRYDDTSNLGISPKGKSGMPYHRECHRVHHANRKGLSS
jgi:hypothetical protein